MISKEDIDSIEDLGTLHGKKVKLVKTRGGFNMAMGIKKGDTKESILSGGSHPAIVKYNLEKEHPEFRPSLMKSEHTVDNTVVEKHTHFLSEELKKSGHDLFSIEKDGNLEFQLTKHNLKIAEANGNVSQKAINISNVSFKKDSISTLAKAVVEKASKLNIKDIKVS